MAERIRLGIEGQDEEKRENALEVLAEGLGDPRLSRALWAILTREETRTSPPSTANHKELLQSQNWNDPWLRAIAARTAANMEEGGSQAVMEDITMDMPEEKKDGDMLTLIEQVIFAALPSRVTARALAPVRTLGVPASHLTRLMRLYPEIAIGILATTSARLQKLQRMLTLVG